MATMTSEGEVRINLEQLDFRDLVHGHEVVKHTTDREGNRRIVRLILSDFGFAAMLDDVFDAMKLIPNERRRR